MLACLLLALLFGIAVAIAVPVSRQNAALRAAAAAPARGPPLTFKVDVAVPQDNDPDEPPVCSSLLGDGGKQLEVRGAG